MCTGQVTRAQENSTGHNSHMRRKIQQCTKCGKPQQNVLVCKFLQLVSERLFAATANCFCYLKC